MIEPEIYNKLSEKDRNILQSLWLCPNDNTPIEKISGIVSGKQEISRGFKKSDIAINNAIAMKKIKPDDLIHAQMVVNITFQLIPNDYETFSVVKCPLCDYQGLAPELPDVTMVASSNIRKNQMIETLIEESKASYKQGSSGGGFSIFRRGGIFLIFILISLLPLIAIGSFLAFIGLTALFRIGLI